MEANRRERQSRSRKFCISHEVAFEEFRENGMSDLLWGNDDLRLLFLLAAR